MSSDNVNGSAADQQEVAIRYAGVERFHKFRR